MIKEALLKDVNIRANEKLAIGPLAIPFAAAGAAAGKHVANRMSAPKGKPMVFSPANTPAYNSPSATRAPKPVNATINKMQAAHGKQMEQMQDRHNAASTAQRNKSRQGWSDLNSDIRQMVFEDKANSGISPAPTPDLKHKFDSSTSNVAPATKPFG